MAYWLVKSEPGTYAFSDLERDGHTVWDGVRNYTARANLNAMKAGEEVLFYHSQDGLAVVGVAKVTREAFPDPGDATGRFVAVELAPVRPLKRPVTLAEMKSNPKLAELKVIRQGRLSVSPVTDDEWAEILRLSEG